MKPAVINVSEPRWYEVTIPGLLMIGVASVAMTSVVAVLVTYWRWT